MSKIIPLLLIFVLCSCTSEPIKTSNLAAPPSDTTALNRLYSKLRTGSFDTQPKADEPTDLFPRISRYLKQGIASWYGPGFHGKTTASGEVYDMYAMTAAHKTLPISSYARVTNLENQRSVIVRINDRGPFHGNRVLDLSYAAAKQLDLEDAGSGAVEIKAIAPEQVLAHLQSSATTQDKNVYLQVGTFSNKKTAQKLQNKIAAHHLPLPKILPSTHKGSTLYRVQIGPVKSSAGALNLNMQLAKLGVTLTQFVN